MPGAGGRGWGGVGRTTLQEEAATPDKGLCCVSPDVTRCVSWVRTAIRHCTFPSPCMMGPQGTQETWEWTSGREKLPALPQDLGC